VGGARSKNSIFRVFGVPLDYPAHSLQQTVLPQTNGSDGKVETLKVCLLLVWRVCDQAFDRYRPLKGAEKWSCGITKIENLHIGTRRKNH